MTKETPSDFEQFCVRAEADLPGVLVEVTPRYLEDPRHITVAKARRLALPKNTQEVAALVRLAGQHRIPLIPYSGGTGLVGGQVQSEHDNAVILSVEKIDDIGEPDAVDRTLKVGAGAILADVQQKARGVGLLFPLSLASEGSCRIGGNLSTNAGGVNVLRYGNARDLCLGLEAVMPDGSVFHGLKPLRKDNTGYDMRHLLIGAEGTLGIITAARLRLVSAPREIVTALFDINGPEGALELLALLRTQLGDNVSALELIHRTGIDFLEDTMPELALPPTGSSKWLTLVEVGTSLQTDLKARFEACLATALERGIITDGHIAQSGTQRDVIWAMRESIPDANRRVGSISSHDISIPVARLPAFADEGFKAIAAIDRGLRVNCFGHVGDGNLHYNIFPPKGQLSAPWKARRAEFRRLIHDLVDAHGGSISAEHGIGRHKRDDLAHYGDPAKIAAMRAIKAALDPANIMNPGAVIEP